ncbi:unnamed protein product [Phytophthora lilii]|uniref:Unnamed protein product n=1 Tax=Phytophthora lilii TaxID=2077276 RepID=A0A9W6TI62_9STRA|nr:unnamed protein product [Phytophthora lilii]
MVGRHSSLAVVLLVFVALASGSSAWALPPQQIRRLNDQELYQRLLAGKEEVADEQLTCDEMLRNSILSEYLTKLPAFGGLPSCVNANVFDLLLAFEKSQCGLSTLVSLVRADSNDSVAFMKVMGSLLGGVTSSNSSGSVNLASTLLSWSTNTSTLQGFCNAMNTQAGPCIEALVPALISLLVTDAMCCHELNGYLEVLMLLVPAGQTLAETIASLINGLHQTMCTSTSPHGELCSASLSSYLSGVVTNNDSLLGAIIFQAGVPLYAASESDVCSSLETTNPGKWSLKWHEHSVLRSVLLCVGTLDVVGKRGRRDDTPLWQLDGRAVHSDHGPTKRCVTVHHILPHPAGLQLRLCVRQAKLYDDSLQQL